MTEWIDVTVVRMTESAVLFYNGMVNVWVPRSQIVDIADDLEPGVATKVELPTWLLERSGLV